MNDREKLAKTLDLEIIKLVEEAEVIEKRRGTIWVRCGQICLEMKRGKLYREMGFSRFDQWTEARLKLHKSQVAVAMGTVEDLSEEVGADDLSEMTLNNAQVLRQIPAKNRKPDIIEAAKTQTERQFRDTVREKLPDLHIEQKVTLTFHLEDSAAVIVARALGLSAARHGQQSREQGLEDIAQEYLERYSEEQEAREAQASSRVQ